MTLRPTELQQVARELDEGLRGAILQRVYLPNVQRGYLELRRPGQSVLLCVSVEPGVARLSVAEARTVRELTPPALQRVLRVQLTGALLREVAFVEPLTARLTFERQGETRTLLAELAQGTLTLLDAKGAPLGGRRPPSVPGKIDAAAPTRLVPASGPFPLATAAEALLEGQGQKLAAEAVRKARLAPLKTRRARIERTIAKVREEASRGPKAEEHRRLGELLGQNLFRVKRGERAVRLTEYTAEGTREVEVPLDPARTPKEQVDWHFHQYRRLLRGAERAGQRLAELEQEREQIDAAIERVRTIDPQELPSDSVERSAPIERTEPGRHRPFKEYRSANGERILVGRGGADNDVLTFKLARPHDLWLHARGVTGAHVVVPLERERELPQELLLDAAHLALSNSALGDEPRGEVSYTYAKFVRKPKGSPPGSVTYTHERTFVVRVEPARLARLRATSS